MSDVQSTEAKPNPGTYTPGNAEGLLPDGRKRIPMSLPRPKMAVPEIPGFRLYWFREDNVEAALQAGYIFVDRNEVYINRNNPGGGDGNTALDSRVSLVGGKAESGAPVRATLMKIRIEWFKEDQLQLVIRQAKLLESIFDKEQVFNKDGSISDAGQLVYTQGSYTGHQSERWKPVMNRPVRKAKIGRGRWGQQ